MPVYNVEKYIEQSLRSVLAQQFKDFELIVVDDASPDNSIEIVERLAKSDARIKIVRHEFNRGLGAARNTGMLYARGKYIAFVDSDDLLIENALEIFHRTAEETDAEVVHCTSRLHRFEKADGTFDYDPRRRRDFNPQTGMLPADKNARLMTNYIKNGMSVVVWLNFFRRDFLERNQLKFPSIFSEDEAFFIAIQCLAERFCCIPDHLYIYSRRRSSITTAKSSERAAKGVSSLIDGSRYIIDAMSRLPEDVLSSEVKSYCLQTFIRRMLSNYVLRFHDINDLLRAETIKNFIQALRPSFIENAEVAARLIQTFAMQLEAENNRNEQSSSEPAFVKDINRDEIRNGIFVDSRRKKLWNVMIELILEVARICKKHNIRWFAYGGTLLGAARHRGFIPWDDDVDLIMFRPDYEKFKRVAAKELNPNYYLDLWYNYAWQGEPNPEHLPVVERRGGWPIGCSFLKIRDNRTTFFSSAMLRPEIHNGIFIDIFPLDSVPPFKNRKQNINFETAREITLAAFFPQVLAKAIDNNEELILDGDDLKKLLSLPYKQRALALENYLAEIYVESEYGYWFYSHVLRGKRMKMQAYQETIELPFEQITLPAPRDYNEVLTAIYGDWRKPVYRQKHYTDVYSVDIPYTEYFAEMQ